MTGYMNNANFSQREFQTPFQDKEMGSPTYSYTESQASSNEVPHNQFTNQATQADPNGSQGSRRAFSLSSMGSKITGLGKKPEESQTNGNKVEKVPKRRGPKPDSKPAQNRRQELNRAAQRTHRERKELYLKDLENRLTQSQETVAQISRQKDQLAQETEELRSELAASKNEVDHLKQLLEANHIPLYRTGVANSYRPSAMGNMSTHSNFPLTDNSFSQNEVPQNHGNVLASYQNNANGYALAENSSFPIYPPLQSSAITGPNSTYGPNAPMTMNFAASPTSALPMSPQGYPSFQFHDSNGFPIANYTRNTLPSAFNDPSDPRFIKFILDLEETCNDHAKIVMSRLNNENTDDISGHALQLSARPLTQMEANSGDYQTIPPQMGTPDLNLMIANNRSVNRSGEVTAQDAAHMIMGDSRFELLTDEDFKQLQENLKAKSRCYGFGAVLEDYEVRDAMDEACAKYFPSSDFTY